VCRQTFDLFSAANHGLQQSLTMGYLTFCHYHFMKGVQKVMHPHLYLDKVLK